MTDRESPTTRDDRHATHTWHEPRQDRMQDRIQDTMQDSMYDDVTAQDLLIGELTAALLEEDTGPREPLPAALADRVVHTGEALLRARTVPPLAMPAAPAPASGPRWLTWGGWLAAAAMLAITLRPANRTDAPDAPVAPVNAVAALRDSLLADSASLVRRRWTPTGDSSATQASGEVLWDPRTQRGVMRFVGLSANDRRVAQYQLWIFDQTRDERYPVDGGVFDITPGTGEVLIPIRARVPVGRAVLFAVTVEKPGGVVVSTRERIAVVAKI